MACTGCNDCKCEEVNDLSTDSKKKLEDKLRIFHDLVCVVMNANCLDLPRILGKFIYMLWCFLSDIYRLLTYLKDLIDALAKRLEALEQAVGELKEKVQSLEGELSAVKEKLSALEAAVAEQAKLKKALEKIINNLESSGAWTGGLDGDFVPNRNIATGNINLFGGTVDGDSFIRTNSGQTENDLAGGV